MLPPLEHILEDRSNLDISMIIAFLNPIFSLSNS